MALPTQPIVADLNPERLRAIIYGVPGAGKTTLAASWFAKSNLIIDLEGGTRFLSGSHFVVRPKTYDEFAGTVTELAAGKHNFKVVTIDTIDALVQMADAAAGQRGGKVAAGMVEYGKGMADRDGIIKRDLARLLATDLGVLICAQPIVLTERVVDPFTKEKEETAPYVSPRVEPGQAGDRLRQPVTSMVDFQLAVAKAANETRTLITGGHAGFETKRRVALPDTLPADAGALYQAIAAGVASIEKENA